MGAEDALRAGTLLQGGKYQIVETLRSEIASIVYLAENNMTSTKVAIRELFARSLVRRGEDMRQVVCGDLEDRYSVNTLVGMFRRKARCFYGLQHPKIDTIYDVFEENGTIYYVAPFVAGESLETIIKKSGPMEPHEAINVMKEVCEIVKYLHSHHIIHLGISPASIIRRSDDGAIFLLDFGICDGDIGIRHAYAPLVTVYSAIEVGAGSSVSTSADVYSLGATLHYLTTGQCPPSFNDIISETTDKYIEKQPQVLRPAINSAMQPFIRNRPQSVGEFVDIMMSNRTLPLSPERGNMERGGVREIAPSSYMVLSFFALLLCAPLGVVAIYKASDVDGHWNRGEKDRARATSRSARNWAIIGIIVGILLIIGYIAYLISQMNFSYQYTYYEYTM